MEQPCTISWERLLDFHEGRLNPTDHRAVELHLQTDCAACRERLQWMQTNIAALPTALETAPVPSPGALAYAQRLARLLLPTPAPSTDPNRPVAAITRWVAELVSATQRSPAVVGARGALLPARQRVYATEQHLITLWDEPEGAERRYLIGQVYAREGDVLLPESVSLVLPDATERFAIQEESEFHLNDVVPGSYWIRCRLPDGEIVLPEVEVGGV